jgi:hypothetical protein
VIIGAGLWWVSTAIGFLQFMIPYLRGDPTLTYHRSVEDSGEGGILVLIENTFRFAGNSFPLMMIVRDFEIATIIFPAIAASAVLGVVILFRTLLPAASDPFSFRQLGLVILVGFAMNMAGGAGYIFGNFIDVPRSQVFAAPGQAVVIVGILGLIALGVQRVTSVSYWMALSVALVVLFFTAGQWFYAHDALYGANSITRQRAPYRELIALVPSVEDDTLLLNFQCVTHPREDLYHSELINGFATRYLYDYTGGSHIQMAVLEYVTFDETGVTFADRIVTDPTEPRHYTYDQMVIVACSDDHLVIVNQFPSTFAPPNAYINAYDPRSRLSKPRISDSKLAILALSTVP